MYVYLVRHGEAASDDVDPARHLTDGGESAVRRLATHLAPLGIALDAIYHSGKTRARQTAEILAGAVRCDREPESRDGLGPADPVKPVADFIRERREDAMFVGHLPFMGKLTGLMLDAREDSIRFHEATIVCLKHAKKHGWQLSWSMHPGIAGN